MMVSLRHMILVIAIGLLSGCATTGTGGQYSGALSVFRQSPQTAPFFEKAYGYAVFPAIGKGALVVGGAYGKGVVYREGVATGRSSLVRLSIGYQLGGQAFSEIIFFKDKRAYDDFTSGTFEFDATASAVAVTAGAQAQVGTGGQTAGASAGPATGVQAPVSYRKGMAVFVHTRGGLMYEASVGGQTFTFEPYGS